MTFSVVSQKIPPKVWYSRDDSLLDTSYTIMDTQILLLEDLIFKLCSQRDALVEQRFRIIQANQDKMMYQASIGKLPVEEISRFLTGNDFANLSRVSRHFHDVCSPQGRLLVTHLGTPSSMINTCDVAAVIGGVNIASVESLFINCKDMNGRELISILSNLGTKFTALKSLRVNAADQRGKFLIDLYRFLDQLSPNQLSSIHLSGFHSLESIAKILSSQKRSIETLRFDYFVKGHESEVNCESFPEMPNLQSLIYDVADLSDMSARLLLARLSAITNKTGLKSLYMPHVQLVGTTNDVKDLMSVITQFPNLSQLVIRFRHLPMSITDIVTLRETFSHLPAVCISDHFIVCSSTWCPWWPHIKEVWDSSDKIDGLSVFREQIDFHALGSSALVEWGRLSAYQRHLWSNRIAPAIARLYLRECVMISTPMTA